MKISEIPQLRDEFHPTKNGDKTPGDFTHGSGKYIWWLCKNGHEFKNSPNQRTSRKGQNCPYCSGRRVTTDNNLQVCFPAISKEWDYEKNKGLTPDQVHPYSMKRVYFRCELNHSYRTIIQSRTQKGSGCPRCSNKTSKPEMRIFSEILHLFPDSIHRHQIKKLEMDIFIPSLNIGIEFDGHYFHKDRRLVDQQKNHSLKKLGIDLIRIREKPLSKISENDVVISFQRELTKKDLNQLILKMIQIKGFETPPVKVSPTYQSQTSKYLNETEFQNEVHYSEYSKKPNIPNKEESFLNTHPEFSKFWDYEKNDPLRPEHFTYGSNVEVYWTCNRGHSYKSGIEMKGIRGRGCPTCQKTRSKQFIRKSTDPRQQEMKL